MLFYAFFIGTGLRLVGVAGMGLVFVTGMGLVFVTGMGLFGVIDAGSVDGVEVVVMGLFSAIV